MSISRKDKKLLDKVGDMLQLHHYSIHAERSYYDWIKQYIQYQTMTCREEELINGKAKIEAFLTLLVVDKEVSLPTQNEALDALVFLYPFRLHESD